MSALSDLLVLELAQDVAGPYCGKLFADYGARVVKIEPPSGDRGRRLDPVLADAAQPASGLFAYLNAKKESVVLDLDSPTGAAQLRAWLRRAAVVIDSTPGDALSRAGIDREALRAELPELVVVSLSWFGQSGPYRDYRADDGAIFALSGIANALGPIEGPPLLPSGHQAQIVAGTTAFIGALGGVYGRGQGLGGCHIDQSIFEAALCFTEVGATGFHATPSRGVRRRGHNRHMPTFPCGIYPCKDGWIGLTALTPIQWKGLCSVLELPELDDDTRYGTAIARLHAADELERVFMPRLLTRPAIEWFELGQAARIPLALVPKMGDLFELPHYLGRGAFTDVHGAGLPHLRVPSTPFRLLGTPARAGGAAPELGEHTASVAADLERAAEGTHSVPGAPARPARPGATQRAAGNPRPLEGVRIADLSMGWSGPLATRHLADLGAEVIKVEACQHFDWWRTYERTKEAFAQIERSLSFNAMNRHKRGITLDLGSPRGREVLLRLVACSDVLIENNAASVMPKLGLGDAQLRTVNPELISLSMPAFGMSGPWRDYRAYGSTVEHSSGLPHLNGSPDDPPTMQHVAWGDAVAGINAAAALLIALAYKRRTGLGQRIDLSQVECLFPLAIHGIVERSLLGREYTRHGNRHPRLAPHGVYRCAGDDRWLAIHVHDDAQWRALCVAIGRKDLERDERLQHAGGRKEREAELDAAVEAWTRTQDRDAAMAQLQAAGVTAAAVRGVNELLEEPQLKARGFWQLIDREFVGLTPQPSTAYRFGQGPIPITSPAPTLGQHNHEVLTGVLGLSDGEIAALERDHVIGTRPR